MATAVKDQSRLIDHFKRVYSLIVGLALTEACKQLFPIDTARFAVSSLWMFFALLVTVIPIFQGGDRFLDVTYFNQSLSPVRQRISFMWDVYMLLLTALILVGVAKSIPSQLDDPARHLNFFYGLAVLFFFDVSVLFAGYIKSLMKDDIEENYYAWIASNLVMGFVSLCAARMNDDPGYYGCKLSSISFFVLVCCVIRTVIDYSIDKEFMFPGIEPVDPNA